MTAAYSPFVLYHKPLLAHLSSVNGQAVEGLILGSGRAVCS